MNRLFLIFLAALITLNATSQELASAPDVNTFFELRIDSIEHQTTFNNWGESEISFLHFKVKNISDRPLTFITNSCFYYNHSFLTCDTLEFDLNAEGGCHFNSHNHYPLAPGESFFEAQWITAHNLRQLTIGEWEGSLSVPLVIHTPDVFRVDGRNFIENKLFLTYVGPVKVVSTLIDERSRRKKRREPIADI